MMDLTDKIDVTGSDPRELIKAAYALSKPQGLGFLHAREGELDDATVDEILGHERGFLGVIAKMDYVHGRSCKFTIWRDQETERLYIRNWWYDHDESQLEQLLARCGIERPMNQPGTQDENVSEGIRRKD